MTKKHSQVAQQGATLADVAARAQVSVSTVSRALSGSASISETTRRAVQIVASELGYRLPTQGRSSRRSATHLVGVVVSALHNRFMTVLLEHLHDELATAGYQVVLIIDAMNETKNLITLRPLIDGYLDGLIFTTATLDSPVVTELQSHGIPIVLVVRSIDNAKVDTIETDNFHAGSEAARHLFELGHRRIGLIMGPANTSTSRDRTRGALFWLEKHGVQRKSIHMVDCEYTHEAGYSAGLGFLRLESPATGIVAGNDTIALGVLDAIRRVGLIVPDHVSVIGFDDIPLAASPLIGLTSIRQPVEIMARTAARRLLSRIASRNIGSAVQHVLPTELILRSSTGPAHGSR